MNASDQMRAALNAVTASMNAAIELAKELGHFDDRDQLITVRDVHVRTANRVCNGMGPRGRVAVPPIVPVSYSLKPQVRAMPARGALRLVETGPSFHEQLRAMHAEAARQARESRKLLEQCRIERGVPDAG